MRIRVLLVTSFLLLPAPATAQQVAQRFEQETPAPRAALPFADRSTMWKAKWATLAASAAVGAYGFLVNDDAEDRYTRLEELCAADTDRCRERLASGAFVDAELEAMYQDIVKRDRRARVALLASQIGLASSVLLFILDLREAATPPNIPYEPELVLRDDGAWAFGVTVRR